MPSSSARPPPTPTLHPPLLLAALYDRNPHPSLTQRPSSSFLLCPSRPIAHHRDHLRPPLCGPPPSRLRGTPSSPTPSFGSPPLDRLLQTLARPPRIPPLLIYPRPTDPLSSQAEPIAHRHLLRLRQRARTTINVGRSQLSMLSPSSREPSRTSPTPTSPSTVNLHSTAPIWPPQAIVNDRTSVHCRAVAPPHCRAARRCPRSVMPPVWCFTDAVPPEPSCGRASSVSPSAFLPAIPVSAFLPAPPIPIAVGFTSKRHRSHRLCTCRPIHLPCRRAKECAIQHPILRAVPAPPVLYVLLSFRIGR